MIIIGFISNVSYGMFAKEQTPFWAFPLRLSPSRSILGLRLADFGICVKAFCFHVVEPVKSSTLVWCVFICIYWLVYTYCYFCTLTVSVI